MERLGTVIAMCLMSMCKQLLIKSEGSNVTAGEDCPLPREALSFYRGGRGWGALLRTGLAVFISTSPFMDLWRPTVRDSISRGRDNGLLGSRHAVSADGRLGSHDILLEKTIAMRLGRRMG